MKTLATGAPNKLRFLSETLKLHFFKKHEQVLMVWGGRNITSHHDAFQGRTQVLEEPSALC